MKETIKILVETNNPQYNLLKASEELQELSLVLTQLVNKPTKISKQEIIDEIGDVKIRIKILEEIFGKDKVQERVDFKLNKFAGYIKEGKYKGGI